MGPAFVLGCRGQAEMLAETKRNKALVRSRASDVDDFAFPVPKFRMPSVEGGVAFAHVHSG